MNGDPFDLAGAALARPWFYCGWDIDFSKALEVPRGEFCLADWMDDGSGIIISGDLKAYEGEPLADAVNRAAKEGRIVRFKNFKP